MTVGDTMDLPGVIFLLFIPTAQFSITILARKIQAGLPT